MFTSGRLALFLLLFSTSYFTAASTPKVPGSSVPGATADASLDNVDDYKIGPSKLAPHAVPASVKLPLVFQGNRRQFDPKVRFLAHTKDGFILLEKDRIVLPSSRGKESLVLRLPTSSGLLSIRGEQPTGGVANYYSGNDPSQPHGDSLH
ncbi:hypothetical protein RBB75_06105 [Tunturibacter empetritectus]|uniref:DUF4968 domain-containing protein n=1 Tax=Tunturiibacter empetritectus TaxID=3069691 RepID=A0AAU7ZGT8_9BACT